MGGFEVPFTTVDVNIDVRVNGEIVNNARAAHEFGHVLGFVDWLDAMLYEKAIKDSARYKNPQNGSDGRYTGIMNSLQRFRTDLWYGKDDKSALKVGGYAKKI